jgi:hypothetical protein
VDALHLRADEHGGAAEVDLQWLARRGLLAHGGHGLGAQLAPQGLDGTLHRAQA